MKIIHEPETNSFVAVDGDGQRMGELEYEPAAAGLIRAVHTRVDEKYRGLGVAEALLDGLATHAGHNGLKVVAVCSYVQGAFTRHPEKYREIMAATE